MARKPQFKSPVGGTRNTVKPGGIYVGVVEHVAGTTTSTRRAGMARVRVPFFNNIYDYAPVGGQSPRDPLVRGDLVYVAFLDGRLDQLVVMGRVDHQTDVFAPTSNPIFTGTVEVPLLLSDGIGIGTTAPVGLLHVSAGTSGDAVVIIESNTDDNADGDNPRLLFRQDGGNDWSAIHQENDHLYISNSIGGTSGGIIFATNNSSTNGYLDATERMRISYDGAVTIAGDLTVNGTTTEINSTTLTVDDKNIVLGSVATPSDTTADGGGITLKGATDKTIVWVNSKDAWDFNQGINVTGSVAITEDLTVNTGNVGIGTTTMTEKLNVIGDAYVQGPDGWNGAGDLAIVALGSGAANERFGCGYKHGTGMILSIYGSGGSFGSSSKDAVTIMDTTGNVGIGTSSPAHPLVVNGVVNVGTNLLLSASPAYIQTTDGGNAISVVNDGAVTLMHDTSARLATSAAGVTVTGAVTATTFSGALSGNAATATTAATVTTNAQTAITSVGTLTGLTLSGDLVVDTDCLFVDVSENRVGVNTASPVLTGLTIGRQPAHANEGGQINWEGGTSYSNDLSIDRHGNDLRLLYNGSQVGTWSSTGKVTANGGIHSAGEITVGADTDGHDVKFFGNATGSYMLWDESEDHLDLGTAGGHKLYTYNAGGANVAGIGVDQAGGPYEMSLFFSSNGKLTIGSFDGSSYSTKMTVLASGNVGIDTASPSYRFQVAHPGTSTQGMFEGTWDDNVNSNSRLIFNDHNFGIGAGQIGSGSNEDDLVLWAYNDTNRGISFKGTSNGTATTFQSMDAWMRIVGGKVGIGTTSPIAKLSVTSGATDPAGTAVFGRYEDEGLFLHSDAGPSHYNWLIATQENVDGGLEITPSTAVGNTTFSTPALVVKYDGSVGIGITTPTTKMYIKSSDYQDFIALDRTGNANVDQIIYLTPSYDGANNTALHFNIGTNSTKMVITEAGNVGIGDNSPTYKLDVNGTARVTGTITADGDLTVGDDLTVTGSIRCNERLAINTSSVTYSLAISDGSSAGIFLFRPSTLAMGSQHNGYEMNVVGGKPDGGSLMGGQVRLGGSARGDEDRDGIIFLQNGTERMRVHGGYTSTAHLGCIGMGDGFTSANPPLTTVSISSSNASTHLGICGIIARHLTYTNTVHFDWGHRASNASYNLYTAYSGVDGTFGLPTDLEAQIKGDGTMDIDGAFSANNGDYAEYFEWEDGNPADEDRRGITVTLVGNKIRVAAEGEDIIGVVSSIPVVIGNAAWNKWQGKYLRDDYGTYIREDVRMVSWTEQRQRVDGDGAEIESQYEKIDHSYQADAIPDGVTAPEDATYEISKNQVLNSDWDEDLEYVPREHRPEWSPIGLIGILRIRKGQPTGASWIKMRDVSDAVEEWLVR